MDKKIFLFLFQKAQGQARGGKYYKREWQNNRWKYWYTKEQYDKDKKGEIKPEPKKSIWQKVGAFFGVKSEKEIVQRVKSDYENSKAEIEQEVGKPVPFETFKNHLAEYFANKEKWDKRFAPKAKKDPPPPKEETTPDTIPTEEPEAPTEPAPEPKESTKEKIQSKAEEFKDSQKWDSKLMRFLANRYSQPVVPAQQPQEPSSDATRDQIAAMGKELIAQGRGIMPAPDNFETMPEGDEQFSRLSDSDLRSKEKAHDNLYNEGGDGQNPFREERKNRESSEAVKEPRSKDDVVRELQKLDNFLAREAGTFDPAKVDALKEELKQFEEKEKDAKSEGLKKFLSEWTPELTQERRGIWNAEMREIMKKYPKNVPMKEQIALEKKLGYKAEDLKKAIAIHATESKKKSPDIKKKNPPSPTGGGNIPIDLSKMQKIKMPKDIKSKGIDSKEYKEWVQENWAKDPSPTGGGKTSDKLKEVPASDITTIEQYTDEKHYNRKVIDGIKDSIVAKGFDPGSPLKVDRDKNGKLRVVDGHHRFTAVQELIKEGKLPSDTPVYVIEEKFDSEADRLLAQVSANKNKRKPERLDDAKAYSQLIEQGKSIQEISQVTGESPEYVRGTLALNNLSDDFKRLLRSDDKQNRVKSKGDGSDTKMESIGEPLAIILGKYGINDDGTPNETIQRKAYMWYVANKHKGITVPQVKSYIDTLKNQQSLGMKGVDESGRSDLEKEALRLVGSEEAAKADSLSFDNFLNQIQKPIQKFLGDTVTDLDEKKAGKLAASIIASKGSSALESELGKISEALNNLNLFKEALSKKFKDIQADSQTPMMFGRA